MVVGLIGIIAPHIYYRYNPVQFAIIAPEVPEKSNVVQKVAPKKKVAYHKVIPVVTPETKEHIERIFGEKADIATATFMHESGLELDQKGWNCHYYNSEGKRYSTSCKTQDRDKAWSVDCGLAQINVKGTTCPSSLLTLEGNMAEVEKRYKTQGLNAWVSYSSGAYKKYME